MGIKKMKNFFYMFDKTAPKHNTFKCCFVFELVINATKSGRIPQRAPASSAKNLYTAFETVDMLLFPLLVPA